MVLAYTDRSASANTITAENWWQIITRPGVAVGRSDPNLDPAGYRALLVFQLAERAYAHPGLADALLAAAPPRNMRPKSVELTGLLQTGDLDYAWEYESAAREAGLRFVQLPPRIDLGDPADSAFYAQASVRVMGNTPRDTIEFRGEPILFALSIPAHAPHPGVAERFVAFLCSDAGRRILHAEHIDILDPLVVTGTGVPPAIVTAASR
jgi:molybdate/tungstate transport system substrate-binding protein